MTSCKPRSLKCVRVVGPIRRVRRRKARVGVKLRSATPQQADKTRRVTVVNAINTPLPFWNTDLIALNEGGLTKARAEGVESASGSANPSSCMEMWIWEVLFERDTRKFVGETCSRTSGEREKAVACMDPNRRLKDRIKRVTNEGLAEITSTSKFFPVDE
jgi:hypothetical protein